MIKYIFLLPIIIIFSCKSKAQNLILYDTAKISTDSVLNFIYSDKRGIESKSGIVYYVESDLKTLTAYENAKIKWRVKNINECDKHAVFGTNIRWIRLDGDK